MGRQLDRIRDVIRDAFAPQRPLHSPFTPAQRKPQAEFEYKTVRLETATVGGAARKQQRLLNKLAAEGWELVSETGRHSVAYGTSKTLTFRRPSR
jgi:hypothetical protein